MIELLIFGTAGCHLCEQAKQVLQPVLDHINDQLVKAGVDNAVVTRIVDITDSAELMELYAIRIPVIRLRADEEELGWPFDESQAYEFLVAQLS